MFQVKIQRILDLFDHLWTICREKQGEWRDEGKNKKNKIFRQRELTAMLRQKHPSAAETKETQHVFEPEAPDPSILYLNIWWQSSQNIELQKCGGGGG